jgi:hypothetical protein
MNRQVILLAVLAVCLSLLVAGCDRQPSTPPAPEPGQPLMVYERTGGIAGFQDRLVIGYNGEYYLGQQGAERIGSLSAERVAQLRGWFVRLAPFTLRLEDNPGGVDNMVRQAIWSGLGKTPATQAEQRDILNWAGELFTELLSK